MAPGLVPVCPHCGRVRCICPPRVNFVISRAAQAGLTFVLAAVCASALLLAGCSLTGEPKAVGTVVELEHEIDDGEFDLTVRTKDGEEVEVEDVPRRVIDACGLDEPYPACAQQAP